LITRSALPLKAVEVDFAADSSGFTTSRFHRWFDHKYGVERQEHDWVKVHIMCGVKTTVVTAIEIAGRNAADTKQLPALITATAQNFAMAEISADKGYASAVNIEAVKNVGPSPSSRSARQIPAGQAACGRRRSATSCTGGTSFWPTITSGRTWKRPSA